MPPFKKGKCLIAILAVLIVVSLEIHCSKPAGVSMQEAVELCNIGWNNNYHVVGHDVGYSIVLPDGGRFWIFGDTWIGEIADGRRKIKAGLPSTGAIQHGKEICSDLDYLTDDNGQVRQLIPGPDKSTAEIANWALSMVASNDRVYIFYERVRKNDKPVQEMNFDVLGIGLVSADAKTLTFEFENDGKLLFSAEEHGFADAIYFDGEYLYGLGCPPLKGRFDRPCRLARVPKGRMADRSSYQIWDGTAWQKDIKHAAVVLESGGSEMTLTRHKGKFLLIYSPPFSCDIQLRTAMKLNGPWSKPQTIFHAKVPESAFCYGGKLQEISDNGQWLKLTWNSNGPLELHARDPNLYWPHAVKIHIAD